MKPSPAASPADPEPDDAAAPGSEARRRSDERVRQAGADAGDALARLSEIMRRLRAPDGCQWDREQTFASIAPYTVEEAYEVADAIERNDLEDLRDELGDLALQVVYHARIAEERDAFDLCGVLNAISDKMVRRHPHVFDGAASFDWEAAKAAEKAARAARRGAAGETLSAPSLLDDVPPALPALTRALKLQKRAARVGFDWPGARHVLDKIVEEAGELVEAQQGSDPDHVAEEYGDLLFVMVNLGRKLDLLPEEALRQANAKFSRRFRAVEAGLAKAGRTLEEATLEEMEALWTEAKRAERRGDGDPPDADRLSEGRRPR